MQLSCELFFILFLYLWFSVFFHHSSASSSARLHGKPTKNILRVHNEEWPTTIFVKMNKNQFCPSDDRPLMSDRNTRTPPPATQLTPPEPHRIATWPGQHIIYHYSFLFVVINWEQFIMKWGWIILSSFFYLRYINEMCRNLRGLFDVNAVFIPTAWESFSIRPSIRPNQRKLL